MGCGDEVVDWCGNFLWGVGMRGWTGVVTCGVWGMRWWTGVASCCGDKVVDWCGKLLWGVEMRQLTGVLSCYRVRG